MIFSQIQVCNLSKISNFRGFSCYFMPRGYNNSKGRAINKLLLQKNCDKIRFFWEAKKGVLISNPKQKLLARKFWPFNHSPNPLLTHQYPRRRILEWNVALVNRILN
jgi:hypothetical protein